jgi:hypothetical protein
MKRRFDDFRKNMQAMKQANITPSQVANLIKASDIWWKISVNLREIEGSWAGAMKQYLKLFKGVPRKNIRRIDDNQPGDSA